MFVLSVKSFPRNTLKNYILSESQTSLTIYTQTLRFFYHVTMTGSARYVTG